MSEMSCLGKNDKNIKSIIRHSSQRKPTRTTSSLQIMSEFVYVLKLKTETVSTYSNGQDNEGLVGAEIKIHDDEIHMYMWTEDTSLTLDAKVFQDHPNKTVFITDAIGYFIGLSPDEDVDINMQSIQEKLESQEDRDWTCQTEAYRVLNMVVKCMFNARWNIKLFDETRHKHIVMRSIGNTLKNSLSDTLDNTIGVLLNKDLTENILGTLVDITYADIIGQ